MKTPKPHQLRGADFIAERKRCALWWVPRRGKTLATVLGLEKLGRKNVLVVCPVTVMPVWKKEFAERGWPESKVCEGSKSNKLEASKYVEGPVICSYESAWRLPLNQRKWDGIVFDESIRLNNWDAKSVKFWFGNQYLTDVCVLLSGAPCPEGYLQLAPQMLLCRGIWFKHTDIWSYLREFWSYDSETYNWECEDHGHLTEVGRRMNIVGQSGTLKDIGVMDTKLFSYMQAPLSGTQERMIRAVERSAIMPAIKGLKMQMIANGLEGEGEDIRVFDDAKTLALKAYIEDKKNDEPGYSCVVMCRFVEQCIRASELLGGGCIHGSVTGKPRQQQIENFQSGKTQVIVCQVKTVKMGIDFSMASEIHYISNSWSGDDRIQSQERATNLNKTEPVGIIDWCAHAVEYAVAESVRGKQDFQMELLTRSQK